MEDSRHSDISDILGALRRRLWIILVCTLAAGVAALAFSLAQTKQYTAEASLLFRDPGFDARLFGSPVFSANDPDREAATNIELVSLDAVADRTAADIDAPLTGSEISEKVKIRSEGQSDVVTVAATDPDPAVAASLANSFAENYIEFRREADRARVQAAKRSITRDLRQLERTDSSQAEVNSLQNQLNQLRTLEALQTGNAELVQPAEVPVSASSPQPVRNALIGLSGGLLLGIAMALLLERLDRRLRNAEEFGEAFDLPALAHVPQAASLRPSRNGSTVDPGGNEAFRMLRARLRYFNVDRNLNSVAVTSASPAEGKSTVAWHLARTSAASGVRAILIEADFHQPVAAERTGLAPLPGLAEVLTHQSPLSDAIQTITVEGGTDGQVASELDVLVAGAPPPNPMELLESSEFAELLTGQEDEYALVVIDTPPVVVMADAIPTIRRASGVLVVGRLGLTTRDAAIHLSEQLRQLGISALGVVVNGVKQMHTYGYYYGQGSGNVTRSRLGQRIRRS